MPKDVDVTQKEEEVTTVSRADYDKLMKQIADLSRQVKDSASGVVNLERTKEHVCSLRLWDGKIVINTTKSWDEVNPATKERVPFIGLYLRGDEEPVKVKLSEFLQKSGRLEECLIKSEISEPIIVDKGTVEVRDVRFDQYKTIGTGVRVPLRVVSASKKFIVALPDGEELTLPEEAVN